MKYTLTFIVFIAIFCNPIFCYADNLKSIIGTWGSADISEPVSYNEKTYFEDGTSCGFILDAPFDDEAGELSLFRGKWKIENGILTSTILETSSPYLTKGKEIKDKVVSVNKTVLVLTSEETGETYKRYRVPENRGDSLCKLPLKAQ